MSCTNPIKLTVVLLLLFASTHSKDWGGITPLKSNRNVVERIFGKGQHKYDGTFGYKGGKNSVWVTYSLGNCSPSEIGRWNVPADTVLLIHVVPLKLLLLEQVEVDLNLFEKLPSSRDLPGKYDFLNETDGMSIDVDEVRAKGGNIVASMYFFPTKAEWGLKCSTKESETR